MIGSVAGDGMTAADIHRGFAVLRATCDPRGHHLLDAFEGLLLDQKRLLDLDRELLAARDRLDRLTASFDTQDHSKQAHLRSVPGGRCV